MKAKELRDLSSEELGEKEKSFKKELYDLNYQRKLGGVEKPDRFGKLKKDIAKILTIIRERELKNERSDQASK